MNEIADLIKIKPYIRRVFILLEAGLDYKNIR